MFSENILKAKPSLILQMQKYQIHVECELSETLSNNKRGLHAFWQCMKDDWCMWSPTDEIGDMLWPCSAWGMLRKPAGWWGLSSFNTRKTCFSARPKNAKWCDSWKIKNVLTLYRLWLAQLVSFQPYCCRVNNVEGESEILVKK